MELSKYDDFKIRYMALRCAAYRAAEIRDAELRYLEKCAYEIAEEIGPGIDLVFYDKIMVKGQQDGELTEEEESEIDRADSALASARKALSEAGIRPDDISRRYDLMYQVAQNQIALLAQEYAAARRGDPALLHGVVWEDELLTEVEGK